jgi:hypothetical protein
VIPGEGLMSRSQTIRTFSNAAAIIALVAAFPGCQRSKYVTGRDTVAVFGDGRFQIAHIDDEMALVDAEKKQDRVLLWDVCDWVEEGDWVFVVNRKGEYVVLNQCIGEVNKYASLADVPPAHGYACGKLKRQ